MSNIFSKELIRLREEVDDYKPMYGKAAYGVKSRVLLIGAVGAGKSSFVNSCMSVGKSKVVSVAYAQSAANISVTTQVNTY